MLLKLWAAWPAGWISQDQEAVIHFLKAENEILRERLNEALDGRRLLLSDKQPLAVLAKGLTRKILTEAA